MIIETDYYPIYQYLANGHRDLSSFGAVLDSCLDLRSRFQVLVFSFIRQTGNHLAHSLATVSHLSCNEGISLPSDCII